MNPLVVIRNFACMNWRLAVGILAMLLPLLAEAGEWRLT